MTPLEIAIPVKLMNEIKHYEELGYRFPLDMIVTEAIEKYLSSIVLARKKIKTDAKRGSRR